MLWLCVISARAFKEDVLEAEGTGSARTQGDALIAEWLKLASLGGGVDGATPLVGRSGGLFVSLEEELP